MFSEYDFGFHITASVSAGTAEPGGEGGTSQSFPKNEDLLREESLQPPSPHFKSLVSPPPPPPMVKGSAVHAVSILANQWSSVLKTLKPNSVLYISSSSVRCRLSIEINI